MPLRVAWKNVLGLLKLGFFSSLPLIAAVWYLGRAEGGEQNTCVPFSQAPCDDEPLKLILFSFSTGVLWCLFCSLLPSEALLQLLADAHFHSWGTWYCTIKSSRLLCHHRERGRSCVCREIPLQWPCEQCPLCQGSELGHGCWEGTTKRGSLWWRSEVSEERGWIPNLSLTAKLQRFGIVLAVRWGWGWAQSSATSAALHALPIGICESQDRIQGFQHLCEPWRTLASHGALVLPQEWTKGREGNLFHSVGDSSEVRVSALGNGVSALP